MYPVYLSLFFRYIKFQSHPLYVRSLAILMQTLGQDHPHTQTVMFSLMMLRSQMSTGMSSKTLQQMFVENPDDIIRLIQELKIDN